MSKPYEPELGQALFGNQTGELDLGDCESMVASELYGLSKKLGENNPDAQAHGLLGGEWGYGQDFQNEVFEMHPYWWGDCECGFDELEETDSIQDHSPDCRVVLPNFRCGGIEVRWYKYIGRGMSVNKTVSRSEWRAIFSRCEASLNPRGDRGKA